MSRCSHITVIIHSSLIKDLFFHLKKIGINHLYSSFGRSVSLSEKRSFAGLLASNDLHSDPVEVLNFYIPLNYESQVMKSIIKTCHLDIPGRGSIFSKIVDSLTIPNDELVCDINETELALQSEVNEILLFQRLTLINCTVSRGLANEIARYLLHLGVVPVISNASGTGLRDRIGLLRITIPKEKEFMSIVVGQEEANRIMESIISWGRLDRPGRGFIWQCPVSMGLINLKASQRSIGQAASIEQIIAAMDSIKGSLSWRQGTSAIKVAYKRFYFEGKELIMQVKEGDSLRISKIMLELGISGATVQPLRTLSQQDKKDNLVIPQEILRIVVTSDQLLKLQEKLQHQDHLLSGVQIKIITVPRAFNYKRPV